MAKRMRLPNGFGQISKISNQRLRRPYRAMVTVGYKENGRPICKLLKPQAYFETYNEAYAALLEYHKNPYVPDEHPTVSKAFDLWMKEYETYGKSKASLVAINAAWDYCSAVYDMDIANIRVIHIKDCINNGISEKSRQPDKHAPPSMQTRIKMVFSMLLDYALECGWVEKNYAKDYHVPNINREKRKHIAFTDEEMDKLWQNINFPWVDVVLIQCYSGWRPKELELLKTKDVDLEARTFSGGVKTSAGKERIVPIHPKIYTLVKSRYEEAIQLGSDRLFNCPEPLTHSRYDFRFKKIVKALNINEEHRPHDPRKQFVTMLKRAGADEYAIKYMVGHVVDDITENIYTERDVEWLRKELEKIQ